MISFKYKSQIKRIKIKTKRELQQRMPPWLQNLFAIKNQIVGFKVHASKYYDAETFYSHIARFFGHQVEIIDANDQLQISFVSDNLNSSSFLKQNQHYAGGVHQNNWASSVEENRKPDREEDLMLHGDLKAFEKKLHDSEELTVLFMIDPVHKKEITESLTLIKSMIPYKVHWAIKYLQEKGQSQPTYSIYSGKKLVVNLNLTRQYKETIQMVIERYGEKVKKLTEWADKDEERDAQFFRQSFEQENEAPSFTTYQLQERLNQEACQDYLARMFRENYLKKYEFLKLAEKCDENFVEFYRIFCEGALDNDYESFKNQVRHKVENNLQLLLSNVDEMDISRPISRQEQRRQNLKKSVPNIQIVKVENYFEILDQIKSNLTPFVVAEVKNRLLDQNPSICCFFSEFLSRKISMQELTDSLDRVIEDDSKRPISRCLPRSAAKGKDSLNINPDFMLSANVAPIIVTNQRKEAQSMDIGPQVAHKREGGQMSRPIEGNEISSRKEDQQRIQAKQIPPMFGSSKHEHNFSPIKYMSDIDSNYKQAWDRLNSKEDLFTPEEYGLLYYYLQTKDDSISNHIQELEWNEQNSMEKLKKFLGDRMAEILGQNFDAHELRLISELKESLAFQCIYQNFKFQSDLNRFLGSLKSELSSHKGSPRQPLAAEPIKQEHRQFLTKKASDSQLLGNNKSKNTMRKYSDENDQNQENSPKTSSFSHPKTIENQLYQIETLNNIWQEEFNDMINYINFTEEKKEEYLRSAFKEGNLSVYVWIHQFIQGSLRVIELGELKRNLRIYQNQDKHLLRILPIFNELMKFMVEEGRLSARIRKWCLGEFLEPNMAIIGAFEDYIVTKDQQEFIENLTMTFELQNSDIEYHKRYIKRIEDIMKSMSSYDEIGIEIFKLYPKQIQALCEVYYLTGSIDDLLDSLHSIHQVESNRRKLKVATLNFTGVNLNPFEYHDGSHSLTEIDQNMSKIMEHQGKSFQHIKFSSIDKKYTTDNRMSVRFNVDVCDEGHIMGKGEYLAKWKECFLSNAGESERNSDGVIVQKLAELDYYCYVSVVAFVYGIGWDVEYGLVGAQGKSTDELRSFLTGYLTRPASQIKLKYEMAIEYLMKNQIDVMFLQEAGGVDWGCELIHEYGWVKNSDSVILYNKSKIGNLKPYLQESEREKLNFNKDSVYCFSDRGYLLLSVHLTSGKGKAEQALEMFKTLEEILRVHPMLKVIVGMDANQYMGSHSDNFLNCAPNSEEVKTSTKKRTWLQAQLHKSGMYTSEVKDHLLSNLGIKNHSVEVISGRKAQEGEMLPNDIHPFDHFVVVGTISGGLQVISDSR